MRGGQLLEKALKTPSPPILDWFQERNELAKDDWLFAKTLAILGTSGPIQELFALGALSRLKDLDHRNFGGSGNDIVVSLLKGDQDVVKMFRVEERWVGDNLTAEDAELYYTELEVYIDRLGSDMARLFFAPQLDNAAWCEELRSEVFHAREALEGALNMLFVIANRTEPDHALRARHRYMRAELDRLDGAGQVWAAMYAGLLPKFISDDELLFRAEMRANNGWWTLSTRLQWDREFPE